MYGSKSNSKPAKKKKSPIRVVIRCAWSGGSRLTVPTTGDNNDPLPPICGSSTLLGIVLRLESALPPSLFQGDAATLVCLRKKVPQSQWESTTLKQMLDGDDGSAGVVLTLDLGAAAGAGGNAVRSSAAKSNNPVKKAISSAATSLNIKPVVAPTARTMADRLPATAAASASMPEPMDTTDDTSSSADNLNKMLPEQAWNQILQSNFDATTKDCLNTLLKIIDNILSRPNEPKVRSIRCANAAFEKKVGRCSGGYDFLYSIGFLPKDPALGGMQAAQPEMLELSPENESREMLLQGREVLIQSAVRNLGMDEDELPPMPKSPASLPASTLTAPPPAASSAIASTSNSRGPTSEFNVYKTHSYNIQSAAVGAPDPYNDASSTMSTTERRLNTLKSKKDKLEREMQSDIKMDRGLIAYRAGSGPVPMERSSAAAAASDGGGKSDGSLVAARMKRMEEERKKREEGGFTTKAMRDLERMKKAKVYSHAQIRVNFSDGTHLHAKFLPSEKVSTIRSVIKSAFQPSLVQSLDFDLYIAPPRRLLNDANTLEDEELVPAAKIHVSWKAGASPVGGAAGYYLRAELFSGENNAVAASSFPDAKPIVRDPKASANSKGKDGNVNGGGGAPSKEELLMQRMLGKKGGFLGGRKSSSNGSDKDGGKKGGKPKWFKG